MQQEIGGERVKHLVFTLDAEAGGRAGGGMKRAAWRAFAMRVKPHEGMLEGGSWNHLPTNTQIGSTAARGAAGVD